MELEKDVSRKREEKKGWWGCGGKRGLRERAGSCRSLVSLREAVDASLAWGTLLGPGFSDLKRNSLREPGIRKLLDTLQLGFECG